MIHYKFIYEEYETLPAEGWFQKCRMCCTITSKLDRYTTITIGKDVFHVLVYVCLPCQKKLLHDNEYWEKYNKRCNRYIRKNSTNMFILPSIQSPPHLYL